MTHEVDLIRVRDRYRSQLHVADERISNRIRYYQDTSSYNTSEAHLLLALASLIPDDAANETRWAFEKILGNLPNEPERYLIVAATTSLFNILDDYVEDNTDLDLREIIAGYLRLPDGSLSTLETMLTVGDRWIKTYIDPTIDYYAIAHSIIKSQMKYSHTIQSHRIDDGIEYRARTLGLYARLLADLSTNTRLVKNLAEIQFNDDQDDVEEDLGTQLTPMTAFVMKYGINDWLLVRASLYFLKPKNRKRIIGEFNTTGDISNKSLQQLPFWSNDQSACMDHELSLLQMVELFSDWDQIEEFYLTKHMQIDF